MALARVADTTPTLPHGDATRLARLWQQRTQNDSLQDYPLGPGDLLEISVPVMEELRSATVRVANTGIIELPLLGEIQTTGLSEKALTADLRRRLEATYLNNAQVLVFLREPRSRQVAVLGAVAKPGLYPLTNGDETLLTMISQAGGLTEEAASHIQFVPAEAPRNQGGHAVHAVSLAQSLDAAALARSTTPLELPLARNGQSAGSTTLALPARPGDVVIVLASGQVLVEGWVGKPGAYKITPGLTMLGAVAAAGGPHFAADTSSVLLISTGKNGEKILTSANLEQLKRGESPDLPLREGDVIEVTSSTVRLVSYGLYHFLATAFRLSAPVM
jgi:polysaccharide biosynthesis/export protein